MPHRWEGRQPHDGAFTLDGATEPRHKEETLDNNNPPGWCQWGVRDPGRTITLSSTLYTAAAATRAPPVQNLRNFFHTGDDMAGPAWGTQECAANAGGTYGGNLFPQNERESPQGEVEPMRERHSTLNEWLRPCLGSLHQ
jgi:hypothetical protein